MFPSMFGELLAPPMAADLLRIAEQWRPQLLVHEQGELAAPLVAAVLGVPSVAHSFGGPVPAGFVQAAAERLAPLWESHARSVPPYAGCFSTLFLDIAPPDVRVVPMDHMAAVQPLRPVSYTGPEPAEPPAFLTGEGPLVYVTLGTVSAAAPVLAPVVTAIAALPVRVLATVGPAGDPSAMGEQPDRVLVQRFVPQTMVLPRSAVVVSHGGSGTFLGALAAAVPQLCLPQAADQFRNAEGGVRSGAALRLLPDEASPDAIRAAVQTLLSDSGHREAAHRQAAAIAAMPSPEEVVPVLERLS